MGTSDSEGVNVGLCTVGNAPDGSSACITWSSDGSVEHTLDFPVKYTGYCKVNDMLGLAGEDMIVSSRGGHVFEEVSIDMSCMASSLATCIICIHDTGTKRDYTSSYPGHIRLFWSENNTCLAFFTTHNLLIQNASLTTPRRTWIC